MKNKYKIFIWCLWGFAIINLLILSTSFKDNGLMSRIDNERIQSIPFKIYSLLVAIAIIISFLQIFIWNVEKRGWWALFRFKTMTGIIVFIAACWALFSVFKGCRF